MNKFLEQYLFDKYPTLYRRHSSTNGESNSLLRWDLSCDNGWFHLIDVMSELIEAHDLRAEIVEVKQKMGGLRVYLSGPEKSHYVNGIRVMAESLSYRTCEICGNLGTLHKRIGVKTLCERHGLIQGMMPWRSPHGADQNINDRNGDIMELPDKYWIDYGWAPLLEALFESLVDHGPRLCQQGQTIHFERIASTEGDLLIDYTGDHKWVMGQIDMVMRYAQRVDEITGDAKPVEQ